MTTPDPHSVEAANAQIDAVTRGVFLDRDPDGETRSVLVRQHFPVPLAALWAAVTTADGIASWLAPIEGELREGGHYAITGNAEGSVLSCDALHAFSVSWEFAGTTARVDVEVTADSQGSTLAMTHTMDREDPTWERFGPGATGIGWDLSLLGLANHLAAFPAWSGEEALAWMQGDAGRGFIIGSAERWGDAAVAAGTEHEEAEAAAEAAARAYLQVELDEDPHAGS